MYFRVLAELAGGEGDHVPVLVANRNHQAAEEADVDAAAFFLNENAGVHEFAPGELFGPRPIHEHPGVIGHPADLPAHGHLLPEAARFQVIAGMGGLAGEEELVEERGDLAMQVELSSALAAGLVFFGIEGFLRDRDTRARGQFLDRIDEGEILVFADEGDGVAALAAAEAMVELPLGIDVERGRFLVVERAQRLERRAGALDLDVGADHVHDIRRGEDLFLGLLRNLRHGGSKARGGENGNRERCRSFRMHGGKSGAVFYRLLGISLRPEPKTEMKVVRKNAKGETRELLLKEYFLNAYLIAVLKKVGDEAARFTRREPEMVPVRVRIGS